ncbi:MAG: type II secretion system F family protein [Candidatus Muiribacteriota bacterium]|jgi:type IV pilus assembly protein PilC
MAEFFYVAVNKSGSQFSGVIEAQDIEQAKTKIESQGNIVKKIKPNPELTFMEWLKSKKIKEKDVFLFTKYLGVTLKAGIPVLKCIDILTGQVENYRLQKKLKKIKSDVEGGKPLAAAFSQYPDVFPNMYTSLLHVGEESGLLFEMVERLTLFFEKSAALKKKVKKAMTYPISIIIIAAAITMFLLIVIIPRFEEMFSSFGADLPMLTQIVLGISDFVRSNGIVIFIGLGLMVSGIKYSMKYPKVRRAKDVFLLKIPLVGELIIKYAVAAFTRNLGVMLRSGLPITKAMNITVNSIENAVIKEEMYQVKEDVESGINITDAFKKAKSMPNMVVEMINIGDQSGVLEDMLGNVADFYEDEVDTLVDAVTGLIEPIFMVFLGITIGTLVLSMFLPIFKMSQAVMQNT